MNFAFEETKINIMSLSKKELLEKCEELGINKCKSKNKTQLIDHFL